MPIGKILAPIAAACALTGCGSTSLPPQPSLLNPHPGSALGTKPSSHITWSDCQNFSQLITNYQTSRTVATASTNANIVKTVSFNYQGKAEGDIQMWASWWSSLADALRVHNNFAVGFSLTNLTSTGKVVAGECR